MLADDVKFTASAQKTPVTQGERFQVTYTLHNASGSRFSPPSFSGFKTLMGPSVSQSTHIVNGQFSQKTSYTFVLQAKRRGKRRIAPASITANGKSIKSNPLMIEVVEPSEAEKRRREAKQEREKTLSQQAEEIISSNLFVKCYVNKSNVYQGEAITATYKIYVHPELNIRSLSAKKEPSFNGFWTQEIDLGEVKWRYEKYDGKRFQSAMIKKVVLLPQRDGRLSIEPYKFDCIARLRVQGGGRSRRSPFDDFFDFGGNYRDFTYVASSKKRYVNVKALPANPPSEFDGAVGDFKFEAWIDKDRVNAGNPISLRAKISGEGNLKLIEPFELNLSSDFEVYEPKIADNARVSSSGMSGSKIFEYIIIPKHEGEYKIEPITFVYFDLSKKKYVTIESDEFNITVLEGDGEEPSIVSGVQKEDVKFLGEDIRFIKTDASSFDKKDERYFGSTWFAALNLIAPVLFVLALIYKRRKRELEQNQYLLKNKRATKVARKRLAQSKKYLTNGDRDKFFEEVARALWGYLSDKLSIPASELNKEKASEKLDSKGVSEEVIDNCLATIDESEFARFASSESSGKMDDIYDKAVGTIRDLEGEIK